MQEKKSGFAPKAAKYALIITAFALTAFALLHVVVGGAVINIFARSADLSGRSGSSLSALSRCFRLQELDLSNSEISKLSGLEKLRQLETLDLRGTAVTWQDVSKIKSAVPGCTIMYDARVGGQIIKYGTEHIALEPSGAENCDDLLLVSSLKSVDITACPLTESIIRTAQDESCNFVWKMTLCGEEITSDAAELVLDSPQKEDIDKLQLFPGLSKVEITGEACLEELFAVRDSISCADITWEVNLAGITVPGNEKRLNISGTSVGNYEEFAEKLRYLPELEYIDMCDCGLSNEQMGALRERYPNTKFVWKITFGGSGKYWTVRTDITCFSTLSELHAKNEWVEPLLTYCTDLVALDLGHNYLEDFTPISKLTNLKVLIIGDSSLKDISSVSNLKKLNYIEMFMTQAKDFSALAELPELKDICVGGNDIEDIAPFLKMQQLDRLWIARCGLSHNDMDQLSEALPNTRIVFFVRRNLCEGWRESDKNLAIRTAFTNWDKVERFNDWDDVVYKEGAQLTEVFKQ